MSRHPLCKKFLPNTQSKPNLSLNKFLLSLLQNALLNSLSPTILEAPFWYLKAAIRSPLILCFFRLNSPSYLSLSSLSSMHISLILSPVWLRHPYSFFPFAELSPKFELWLLAPFFPGVNHSTTSESPSLLFSFILHLCLFSQSYSLSMLGNITKELI